MKHRIALLLLSTLLCSSLLQAEDITVRLALDDWAPWVVLEAPGYGPVPRVVSAAFASQGIQVEYVTVPRKRAYLLAEAGQVDGTIPWTKRDERLFHFLFSDVLFRDDQRIFYHASIDFDWQALTDLANYRIGIVTAYSYSNAFDRYAYQNPLMQQVIDDNATAFRMLSEHRIDIFICSQTVAEQILASGTEGVDADQIRVHDTPFQRDAFYLLLNRRLASSPENLQAFNRGLQQLHASGDFDRLMQWDSTTTTNVYPAVDEQNQ